jgi:hypothetical protein
MTCFHSLHHLHKVLLFLCCCWHDAPKNKGDILNKVFTPTNLTPSKTKCLFYILLWCRQIIDS